jgi:hypothetical protein
MIQDDPNGSLAHSRFFRRTDLGQTVTILANLGVIGGIVFLAFEMRQNTAQMRAEASYSVHQDIQRLNEAIYQSAEFADLLTRAEQSYDSLDANEKRRARAYFFSEINLADFITGLEEEGISGITFDTVDIEVENFRNQPGRREFIESIYGRGAQVGQCGLRSRDLCRRLTSE